MPRTAAIFDLDGTLLAGTSAERLFLRRALRSGLVPPWSLATGAARTLAQWTAGSGFFAASKAYLHGLRCAPLEQLGVEVVNTEVQPRLRPALLAALEEHRRRGDRLVVLSGTLDFLGTEVARLLGVGVTFCARLERQDGMFTGRIVPPYPHGAGKVEALRQLAVEADLDLAASHAYANDASDIGHLALVGHAHVVAPDRRLRRAAVARQWSIDDAAAPTANAAGAARRGR